MRRRAGLPLFLAGAKVHLFATTSRGSFLGTLGRSNAPVRLRPMRGMLSGPVPALGATGAALFGVARARFRSPIGAMA